MRAPGWLTLLFTTVVGCATGGGPRVPDERVARLTGEQRVNVDAAQKAQADADLAVASQRVGLRAAELQVEIAEYLVEREQAAGEVAKRYVTVARDSDAKERQAEAAAQLAEAEQRLARAKANLAFRERAEDWHSARVEHADALHGAAGARLELERFNAVTAADLIEDTVAAPERGKYEEAIKGRELAVAEAQTEVSQSFEAMRTARAAADALGGPLDGSPQGLVEPPPTGEPTAVDPKGGEAVPVEPAGGSDAPPVEPSSDS